MDNCLFCKIAKGTIAAEKVYESEKIVAFKDVHPKAPVHVLVIPREHIDSLATVDEKNSIVFNELFLAVKKIAQQQGILESGFRTIINCNKNGGQEVFHLHIHILGGKKIGPMVVPL